MAAYYLDASAAVKCYVAEHGSYKVLQLLEEGTDHELHLSQIGVVEVFAALYRRACVSGVDPEEVSIAAARLREDVRGLYKIVEVSTVTAEWSVEVAEKHRLRAYDCLQLATALLLRQQRVAFALPPLILVSSDRELNAVAVAEGMLVEDPADSSQRPTSAPSG